MKSILKSIICAAFSCACVAGYAQAKIVVDSEGNRMLQMPAVPATLTSPQERASYVAERFWDNMDFSDSVLVADRPFMEQQFANFVFMLSLSGDSIRELSINKCLDAAAAASGKAYDTMLTLGDDYLAKPWSPSYDENLYLPFMAFAARHGDDFSVVAQSRYDDMMKNRVGSTPADFAFTTREGKSQRLSDFTGPGTPVLLIFYDPSCDDCHELIRKLSSDRDISRKFSEGKLNIVAVYAGDEEQQWRADYSSINPRWTVGLVPLEMIDEDELYIIPFTPSTYLIDGAGKIILKNVYDDRLFDALHQL